MKWEILYIPTYKIPAEFFPSQNCLLVRKYNIYVHWLVSVKIPRERSILTPLFFRCLFCRILPFSSDCRLADWLTNWSYEGQITTGAWTFLDCGAKETSLTYAEERKSWMKFKKKICQFQVFLGPKISHSFSPDCFWLIEQYNALHV